MTKDRSDYLPVRVKGRLIPPRRCRGCDFYLGEASWEEFYQHVKECPHPWDSISRDYIERM